MQEVKLTSNLEFEVQYADGERKHVEEGVLFEFDENNITAHVGTSRKEAIFSIIEATFELCVKNGMENDLKEYLGIVSPSKGRQKGH